jgi:hypothetical protein
MDRGTRIHPPVYAEAVQALYTGAYTLKFKIKKELGVDYPVMTSERLWWMDDMREFSVSRKDDWKWTMMIMQPEIITLAFFVQAIDEALTKKRATRPNKAAPGKI